MIEIIPSMLVTSEEDFKKQIKEAKDAVEMVQIDLADGEFVPNTTWPYQNPTKAGEYINIDFELHLMVVDPLQVIKDWSGHPRLKRILVHHESVANIASVISELKILKKEIGVVLNPDTSILKLDKYIDKLDAVMFMGINPGFQGQKFIPKTLKKIEALRAKNPNIFIEVDGAVNEETITDIVKAGANAVCPGSAVFGNDRTPAENVKNIRKIISNLT